MSLKGRKSKQKIVVMSLVDNIEFIHIKIIKEELKQKENEDLEDEHDYDLNDKIMMWINLVNH